jgi:hypothetical protein
MLTNSRKDMTEEKLGFEENTKEEKMRAHL